jgi:hypothetical protein
VSEQRSHDRLWKDLLHRFLPEFLTLFFPAQALDLDLSRVEFLDTEQFTDLPGGETRAVDVLAKVRTRTGERRVILVHVEIEARYRRNFPRRMYDYYSAIRLRHKVPILPIALYLTGGEAGLSTQRYEERPFGALQLLFEFRCVGLSNLRAPDFAGAANPMAAAAMALMNPGDWSLAEAKYHSLEKAVDTAPDEAAQVLIVDCIKTYKTLSLEEEKEVEEMARTADRSDVLEALSKPTWGEQMRQEARAGALAEGRLEGRLEGRQEGRAEGARTALLTVLQARFGDQAPPKPALLKLATSVEELEDLIAKAATAESVAELGLPAAKARRRPASK